MRLVVVVVVLLLLMLMLLLSQLAHWQLILLTACWLLRPHPG